MADKSEAGPRNVTAEISLGCDEWRLNARVTVPAGPTTVADMLPLARRLADIVIDRTCQALEATGEKISCKAGCGACCRNLVAISEVEARRLATLVAEMPEPRRTLVRERFAESLRRLDEVGMLQKLRSWADWTDDEYRATSELYFRQQVPCPFLEDESCSIHPERPITCREYLVCSPAENCSQPMTSPLKLVQLPVRVFNAVARWQVPPSEHFLERWVPLVLALEWAERNPDPCSPRPGVELLRELLEHLTSRQSDRSA